MPIPNTQAPESLPDGATRLGVLALFASGFMFLLYPLIRPYENESTLAGAISAMASRAWIAAHLFAMFGFILLPFGLLALRHVVKHTMAESVASAAVVLGWFGAGMTLPYYGAEDFGLSAIAQKAAQDQTIDLLQLAEAIRFSPAAATTFTLGLFLLGAASVLAAMAVFRSGILPRFGATPFAVGFSLYIPQFFLPKAGRIGHGLLVASGMFLLAALLLRAKRPNNTEN